MLEEEFNKISTRSSLEDLHKIMQRLLREFHQDLCKIFSQGIEKDLDQDLLRP